MPPQDQQNPQQAVDPSTNTFMPPPPQKSSKLWMIIAILAIVALLVVSGFAYYKRQQYLTKVGSLSADVNALNARIAEEQAAMSDKNLVIAQAKANCESQKGTVFVLGTVGTNKEQVEFSSDNTSARLVASCQTGTAPVLGSSKTYVFKKSNGAWSLVITTASPITKAEGEKYALPAAWYQSGTTASTTNTTTTPSTTTTTTTSTTNSN